MKNNYVVLSSKTWNRNLHHELSIIFPDDNWYHISSKDKFNFEYLNHINPDKIFIPHWSHIIPSEIYLNFECLVFHMTDLPYGRGGSPLQNLIIRGHESTTISALRVSKGIDTGPIYLKKPLSLLGSAEEIFIRANTVIKNMIIDLIVNPKKPLEQTGEVVSFKRRKPEDGCMNDLQSIGQAYNYIRMLDADGYPKAFMEIQGFRLEFDRASLKAGNEIEANVRIFKK